MHILSLPSPFWYAAGVSLMLNIFHWKKVWHISVRKLKSLYLTVVHANKLNRSGIFLRINSFLFIWLLRDWYCETHNRTEYVPYWLPSYSGIIPIWQFHVHIHRIPHKRSIIVKKYISSEERLKNKYGTSALLYRCPILLFVSVSMHFVKKNYWRN